MKVYIVRVGETYEPFYNIKAFSKRDDALEHVQHLVNQLSDEEMEYIYYDVQELELDDDE